MKKGSFLKRSAVVAFGVLLMAGCGGSGVTDDTSGGGTGTGTGTGGTGTGGTGITSTCTGGQASSVLGSVRVDNSTAEGLSLIGASDSNRPQQSTLTFSVCGDGGLPLAGVDVSFALETATGGITLNQASAVSDSGGQVQVTINSGTVPVSTRIIATAIQNTITKDVRSNRIAIGTGYPAAMSVSVSTFNIDGYNTDNTETTITASISDRFSAPVPDGTAVSFRANGGRLSSPSCNTTGGICSVTFFSQDFRQNLYSEVISGTTENISGRVRVLVQSFGEERYTDIDGSGTFSSGDTFLAISDSSEPYHDINENNAYDSTQDERIDLNGDNVFTPGDGSFTGPTCDTANSNVCTSTLAPLSENVTIVMSAGATAPDIFIMDPTQYANYVAAWLPATTFAQRKVATDIFFGNASNFTNPATDTLTNGVIYRILTRDLNGNPLAAESTVALAFVGDAPVAITGAASESISNGSGQANLGPFITDFSMNDADTDTTLAESAAGTLAITVTPVGGAAYTLNIAVDDS